MTLGSVFGLSAALADVQETGINPKRALLIAFHVCFVTDNSNLWSFQADELQANGGYKIIEVSCPPMRVGHPSLL